jgi:hypothetical protein
MLFVPNSRRVLRPFLAHSRIRGSEGTPAHYVPDPKRRKAATCTLLTPRAFPTSHRSSFPVIPSHISPQLALASQLAM